MRRRKALGCKLGVVDVTTEGTVRPPSDGKIVVQSRVLPLWRTIEGRLLSNNYADEVVVLATIGPSTCWVHSHVGPVDF